MDRCGSRLQEGRESPKVTHLEDRGDHIPAQVSLPPTEAELNLRGSIASQRTHACIQETRNLLLQGSSYSGLRSPRNFFFFFFSPLAAVSVRPILLQQLSWVKRGKKMHPIKYPQQGSSQREVVTELQDSDPV